MHTCPICNEPGITTGEKFLSGTWNPAICSRCRGKAYANPLAAALFGVASQASFLLLAWLALVNHSWIPLVFFFLIIVAAQYAIVRWVPLVPAKQGSLKGWKLAVVAVASALLFFPVFWIFSAIAGQDWGAGIALVGMFVVFPVFGLRLFSHPRKT